MNKIIYLHLQPPCGLCNRLYSLETALKLRSLIPHSRIEVQWPLGSMMSTPPEELLKMPEIKFNLFEESEHVPQLEASSQDVIYREKTNLIPQVSTEHPSLYTDKVLRTLINPRQGNIRLIAETGMHIKFDCLFKSLNLNDFSDPIAEKVLRLEKKYKLASLKGVHFRGQDFRDVHPEHTNSTKFIEKLKRLQNARPFFISTDEDSFLEKAKEVGVNFISQKSLCYDRSNPLNATDAAVDLLLLSRCKSLILSSHNSTFGLYAKHLQEHKS